MSVLILTFVNINSQLAINTLGSIGIDFDIIRKRPYKL